MQQYECNVGFVNVIMKLLIRLCIHVSCNLLIPNPDKRQWNLMNLIVIPPVVVLSDKSEQWTTKQTCLCVCVCVRSLFVCTLKHTNWYSFEQQQFKSWKGNTKTNRTQKAGEQSVSACGNKTFKSDWGEAEGEKERRNTVFLLFILFFYKTNGIVNEQNQKWHKKEKMFSMVLHKISLFFFFQSANYTCVIKKPVDTPHWKNKPCSNVTIVSKGGIVLESSLSLWSMWCS